MAVNDDVTPSSQVAADVPSAEYTAVPDKSTAGRIGWPTSHNHRDWPHLRRDPVRGYETRADIWDIVLVTPAAVTCLLPRWSIRYKLRISHGIYDF